MKTSGLATAFAVFGVLALASAYKSSVGSVYLDGGSLKVAWTLDCSGAVACGNFTDQTLHPSAFGELSITTNPKYNDSMQLRAAGFLEGALTSDRIIQQFNNANSWVEQQFKNQSIPAGFQKWFAQQDSWMREQIRTNSSAWWQQLGLIVEQFDGLVAGYNAVADTKMSVWQFQELNGIGDIIDLLGVIDPTNGFPDWDNMAPDEIMQKITDMNHCSGLIRVTGNLSELYAAHSSWFTYSSMLRIYKHYNFQVKNTNTASRKISFSSYPGVLSSIDDFYQMWDSKMVMVQTTNSIFNKDLYKLVKPQSLLAWHRVRTANQAATSGKEWCAIIDWHNSGTYNNQYMVVKMDLFTPGQALPNDLLWVCEQIPGLVVAADTTQQLERGYWPSYNVPYFEEIYRRSGYKEFIAKYSGTGNAADPGALAGIDYQLAPRAKIFRRDAGKVETMDEFKAIMRSNDYDHDPYFPAPFNPYNAICSRGDLIGRTGGCYDTKVTSFSWFNDEHVAAINGPTTAGGTLPPFKWSPQFENVAHEGQPDEFDFVFEDVYPQWFN